MYVIQKTGDIELVFPATNITCHTKTLKQYSGFLTVKIPNQLRKNVTNVWAITLPGRTAIPEFSSL